jgi:hypothetical protein
MGQILTVMSHVIDMLGRGPIGMLLRFLWWFYTVLVPFLVQYIGIPMFALGVLLALAFAGGTILFTVVFFIIMFFFIKGVFFSSKPSLK